MTENELMNALIAALTTGTVHEVAGTMGTEFGTKLAETLAAKPLTVVVQWPPPDTLLRRLEAYCRERAGRMIEKAHDYDKGTFTKGLYVGRGDTYAGIADLLNQPDVPRILWVETPENDAVEAARALLKSLDNSDIAPYGQVKVVKGLSLDVAVGSLRRALEKLDAGMTEREDKEPA